MSSRGPRTGLVGAVALLSVVAGPRCALRVGSGGPPAEVSDPPSACSLSGAVRKLSFGAGSTAFAFVWDIDHYVVAYVDPKRGAGDIYVAKVGRDGSPIDSPVAVESTAAASDLPSLVKTANGFLVVWQEGTAGSAVFAHALGPDATPVGSGVTVAATQSTQSRPVLSRAPGGRIAVTWMDSVEGKGGVQMALVDPKSLTLTGPQRIAADDVDGWPWVAGDDDVLAMAWSDQPGAAYDVRFARIDPQDLSVSQPVSLRGAAAGDGRLPRLIRTSFGFMSAWEDMRTSDNEIYMALVDSQGKKIGGGLVEEANTGDANWPNIAWTGAAAGVVYYQFRTGRPQIFMSFVDRSGARVAGLHDVRVSDATTGWSKYPDVLWTGSAFGVMYVDTRDGAPALWLQSVTCISVADAGTE